jgi:hypothetical protein
MPNINFNEKWAETEPKLFKAISENNKNNSVKNVLSAYNKVSFTSRVLITLQGLHSILFSTSNVGKNSRVSIHDSFSSMVILLKEENQLDDHIHHLREDLQVKRETLQPVLIAFGRNYESVSNKVILVFEDVKYQFDNVVQGLECLLKVYEVFGLMLPAADKDVYKFLKKILLGLETDGPLGTKAKALLHQMEK